MDNPVIAAALSSWADLNKILSMLREDQVKEMMEIELANRRRKDIVERLHQRYSKLRTARERKEIEERLL
jgi:Trp operon repressor